MIWAFHSFSLASLRFSHWLAAAWLVPNEIWGRWAGRGRLEEGEEARMDKESEKEGQIWPRKEDTLALVRKTNFPPLSLFRQDKLSQLE